ncbi:MAG: protocatechuate 3,4-dioxygenase, beta subunit [Humisphaera sp.]|nr:protocatechuate 3,4-dioxygenase, beta subunit [Humisphaera sp.]
MNTSRRQFLTRTVAGVAAIAVSSALPSWAFAEELVRTPRQTEGPFYPDHLPLDTDNDLLIVNDAITSAVGEVTHLTGKILDVQGAPIRNALVEIWQCDANGAYLHTGTGNEDRRDKNFQGFGRFLTGTSGEYYFRTIKPVAYPGRTPHIHFAIKAPREERFTTQCYIRGEPRNDRDGVLRGVRDEKQRAAVQVPFERIKESKIGELAAKFDVVMGFTPTG